MSSLSDRMMGDSRVSEGTVDDLLQVFGVEGVQGMFDHGQLSAKQVREWRARQPTPPAFGASVPPDPEPPEFT